MIITAITDAVSDTYSMQEEAERLSNFLLLMLASDEETVDEDLFCLSFSRSSLIRVASMLSQLSKKSDSN